MRSGAEFGHADPGVDHRPIAAGKNTVANSLADHYISAGRTFVIADVDDVAAMVCTPGAGATGLWFAAHQAHGALVSQWMRSEADVVISVGPIYSQAERDALFAPLPAEARVLEVLIDAPLSTTWARVQADQRRGASESAASTKPRTPDIEPFCPRFSPT